MNVKLLAQMPEELRIFLSTNPCMRRFFDQMVSIKVWF